MGIIGDLRGAQNLLKGMTPEQVKELMEQAKESKGMMEEVIRAEVAKAVKELDLITRAEAERMIAEAASK